MTVDPNNTFPPLLFRGWEFMTIYTTTIGVLTIVFNGAILLVFLKDHNLRNRPFNVILMYLLASNVLQSATQRPLTIIAFQYSYWWTGKFVCILYYYSNNVFTYSPMVAHLLISFNRVWAVTFPLSHRKAQTFKVATSLCVVLWSYTHIVVLPGMITHISAMRFPLEIHGCRARYPVHMAVRILIDVVPLLLVTVSYLYIAFKRYMRARGIRPTQTTQPGSSVPSKGTTCVPLPTTARKSKPFKPTAKVDHAFLVLTVLTGSAVVCWAPRTVMFLVAREQLCISLQSPPYISRSFRFYSHLNPRWTHFCSRLLWRTSERLSGQL